MTHLIDSLAHNALLLLAAVTILLALGAGFVAIARSPAHRQRIGELTLAAVLGWLVLAAIPLPRWLPGDVTNGKATAQADGAAAMSQPPTDSASVVDSAAMNRTSAWQSGIASQPIMLPSSSRPTTEQVIAATPAFQADATLATDPQTAGTARAPVERIDAEPLPMAGASRPTRRVGIAAALHLATPPAKPLWPLIAAWCYLGCAAAAAFWLLLGHALLIRERFTAAAPPAWLYRLLHNSVSTWRGRLPRLVVSRRASRPLSWGVWRPIIALPERICDAGNREQLRTILLHEMGHIERSDARGCLLFELAFPLLFFHPLYWWLRGQVRMAAELVADDWAARQTGKEIYVTELVALARGTRPRRLSILAGTGVLSSPSQFYRRMQMLLTRENPLATRPTRRWRLASLAGLAVAVAFAAALAGTSPAADEKGKPAPTPETPKIAENAPTTPIAKDGPAAGVADALPAGVAGAPGAELSAPIGVPAGPVAGNALPPAKDVPATTPPIARAGGPLGLSVTEPVRPTEVAVDPTPQATNVASADQLLAEKKKLLDEIQALRARLHQLEGSSAGAGSGRMGISMPGAAPDTHSVILTHIDDKGHLLQERWTTDEHGKPDKIIERNVSEGNLVKVYKDQAGHVVSLSYDAKSGRLIESREVPAATSSAAMLTPPAVAEVASDPTKPQALPPRGVGGPPGIAPAPKPAALPADQGLAPPPAASPYDPNASQPPHSVTPWQTSTAAPSSVSTRPIDLVALASSYADAVSAVELAKAKLAEAEAAGQSNELRSRKVAVENAVRKGNLLRRIAQVALAGAKKEADRMASLRAAGAISADAASEVEARVEILKQIIDTGGGGDPMSEPKPRTN